MSVFTPFEGAYSNHIGGAFTHPVTGAVYFVVTFRKNSQGPYILQVWEDPIPYGNPTMIRSWTTGTEDAGPGPWGYGTCTWTPDGSLYVAIPGGVVSSAVQPSMHVEHGLFPPIPLLSALEAQIAALNARLNALPPTTTGGTLIIPAQNAPVEGGEIVLHAGDGGEPWHIDECLGALRFHRGGKVIAQWFG